MNSVGIGVIGCGRIAQVAHLPALEKAAGAHLAAVADVSERLAQGIANRYRVPGFTSLAELLSMQQVEAVIVAVPDRFHATVAEQALTAGKHVLVEKPMATSTAEALHVGKVAKASGLRFQVGVMKRHDPGIRFAAEAIPRIGRVLSASIWYRVVGRLRPAMEATLFPPIIVDDDVRSREASFKADRERYLLATHGAHVFDVLRYLVGDVSNVNARVACHDDAYTWHGFATLGDGGIANFEISSSVHGEWSEGVDVYGELGCVRVRSPFPFLRSASRVEIFEEASLSYVRPVFGDGDAFKLQLEAFAAAVRSGGATSPDADDGIAAIRLIETVEASVGLSGRHLKGASRC